MSDDQPAENLPAAPNKRNLNPTGKGGALKGEKRNPAGKGLWNIEMGKWRADMTRATRKVFTQARIERLLGILVEIAEDPSKDTGHRIAAIRESLDRVYGKARVIEDTDDGQQRIPRDTLVANIYQSFGLTITQAAPQIQTPQAQGEVFEGEATGRPALPAPADDEQCGQCGAVVQGHHACEGVPGGFGDDPTDGGPEQPALPVPEEMDH